jgi:NAD(P)-dependent dehydrogenase (short-subunit alcohol dehydrogenase family)
MNASDTNRRIALVTGATDGMGRAIARDLAGRGWVVIAHGRNQERLDALVRELPKSATIFPYRADFASLEEVRSFAHEVAADFPRIDVLLNNAGVGSGADRTKREESRDGYELRLAVNYLAPFVLTNQLLPTLRKSASARIVNVASVGQQPFDFDDPMLTRDYDGTLAYSRSKLALIAFTFELAERMRADGIANVTANALHPASLMPTTMVMEGWGYSMSTLEEGVDATLRLIEAADLEGVSGRYYDGLRDARAKPQAYDAAARRKLWDLTESLVRDRV